MVYTGNPDCNESAISFLLWPDSSMDNTCFVLSLPCLLAFCFCTFLLSLLFQYTPRRILQGMLVAFTRNATTKMMPWRLTLRSLAKFPDSALWSAYKARCTMPQAFILSSHALILGIWRCQNLWDLFRDPLSLAQ